MNHGSLGFFNEEGQLSLNQQISDSLCLGNKSKLYGIFYPCPPPSVNPVYAKVSLKFDFMLTPIPFRYWPVSAKLHIHLLQHEASLNKICEYFQQRGISIIHGESTRSAYRYATWSLHIAFENLINSNELIYNKKMHCYGPTQIMLDKLIKDIKEDDELNKYLFRPDSFDVIEGVANSPLACFADFTNNNTLPSDEKQIVKAFDLTLNDKNKQPFFSGDTQYQYVISHLKSKYPDIFPAVTFAELHQRALNIRCVVIPRSESKRFFRMGIEYKRIGGNDSCVGIIHSITSKMENYNIWQSFNYTIDSSLNYDKGHLVFLLENNSHFGKKKQDGRSKNSYLEEAGVDFQKITKEPEFDNITFDHLTIVPLPDPLAIKSTFEVTKEERDRKQYKYDLFISYSHHDESFVKNILAEVLGNYGLELHLDKDVFKFGDDIDTTLLSNILNSREMCVVVSKDSINSEWVTTEWGAAWVLNKTLVPIVLKKDFDIPERLKRLSSVIVDGDSTIEIEKYAQQLLATKMASEESRFSYYFNK